MIVYKFLNAKYGLEAILRTRIKISHFDKLNDPFDCHAVKFDTAEDRFAWQKTVSEMGKDRGLSCFSKHFHNPLLWSHYAEDHQGIVLELEVDDKVPLLPMRYANTFLDARGFRNFDQSKKKLTVKGALSRKFMQWKYESEVRAFIDLDHSCAEKNIYFLDFDYELRLSKVILGARYGGDREIISTACSSLMVEVRQAVLSSNRYEVICSE